MIFRPPNIYEYDDARRAARRRLPRMVFDYIDGAAGTGHGETLNLSALAAVRLQPRVLVDVSHRDLSVCLLGESVGLPFGTSPSNGILTWRNIAMAFCASASATS